MSREFINQSVSVDIPDGFSTMTAEELRQAYQNSDPNRWGSWNREGHVIITVMWKDYPVLLSMLADTKAVSRKNEQLIRKGYEGHDYQCGGFFSLTAGGLPAEGYRYSYTNGGIEQSAETVLIRKKRTVYSITCTGRAENRQADHETFLRLLTGISFQ